jgi:hypothetical protein
VHRQSGAFAYIKEDIMNIEYERNGVKKITNERFRKDLEAVGWTVVEVKEVKAKKKAK